MSDGDPAAGLREQITAIKFKDPEDAGYVRAYAYGHNEAIDRVLSILPESSVTEERNAIVNDRLRTAIERGIDTPWQPKDPRDARTQLTDAVEAEVRAVVSDPPTDIDVIDVPR